jgi:diphthamide biosynthesis protein 7
VDTITRDSCTAVSLAQVDTEYSADCIEWCPFAGYQDLFVCGTYQVLEPSAAGGQGGQEDSVQADVVNDDPDDGDDDEVDRSDAPKKQTQRTGRLLLFQVDPGSGSPCVMTPRPG